MGSYMNGYMPDNLAALLCMLFCSASSKSVPNSTLRVDDAAGLHAL